MKRLIGIIAILLIPLGAIAAEFTATVIKVDRAKNMIVVRTDKGEETLEVKGVKGGEHAKEGARVTIKVNDKDGKVSEIKPGE